MFLDFLSEIFIVFLVHLNFMSSQRQGWLGLGAKQKTRNQRENKEEREVKWNRERRSFTQWTKPEATSEGVSQVVGGDTGEEQEEES